MNLPLRAVCVLHALLLALLLSAGCAATNGNRSATPASGDGSGKPAASKSDDAEDHAEKVRKKERELEYARMELEIAKLSVAGDERESAASVQEATQKLEAVRKDQDNFTGLDKPTQVASSQLSLDRSQQSMEEIRQELGELEAMYKQEDFAELTKELVISRNRKRLEFSQRGYELAKKNQEELYGHELPKKEKELAQAVEKAEKGLKEAEAKKDRGALESKLKLMRSEHKIDELERELEKLKKKGEEQAEKKEAAA